MTNFDIIGDKSEAEAEMIFLEPEEKTFFVIVQYKIIFYSNFFTWKKCGQVDNTKFYKTMKKYMKINHNYVANL